MQTEAEEKLAKATERIADLESEATGAKRAKDSISGEAAAYEKKAKLLEDKLVSLTAQVTQLQVRPDFRTSRFLLNTTNWFQVSPFRDLSVRHGRSRCV